MVLVLHLQRVDHVVGEQDAGVQAADVLAPLQLQALRAGRRAFQGGRGRRQRARPGQQRRTQRTGADGVYSLDLDATVHDERNIERERDGTYRSSA